MAVANLVGELSVEGNTDPIFGIAFVGTAEVANENLGLCVDTFHIQLELFNRTYIVLVVLQGSDILP